MKIKIQIKHYITGSVLFEYESKNNTLRETVQRAISEHANLSYANLSYANLSYADLSSANLSSANLRSANLSSADLSSANLRYANLRSANLRYANLSYADLSYADLRYANLRYADLSYAKNLDSDATDFWWHVHHEILVEHLTEPVRTRINYIKNNKPEKEVKLRLQLLRPVIGKIPNTDKGWERLHKKECKCGWDGKTIFTEKNGFKAKI